MALLKAVGSEYSAADHGVHAAHPGGFRGDQHLPGGRHGLGQVDDFQTVGVSELPDHDGFHLYSSGR